MAGSQAEAHAVEKKVVDLEGILNGIESENHTATSKMSKKLLNLLLLFVFPLAIAKKDPNSTVLNRWPMVMAHDAATTYLDPTDPKHPGSWWW